MLSLSQFWDSPHTRNCFQEFDSMVFVNLPRMSLHSLNGNVSGTSYWKLLLGDGPLLNGGLLLGGLLLDGGLVPNGGLVGGELFALGHG